MEAIDFTIILLLFAVITILANILTEIVKSVVDFGGTAKLNLFVVIESEVLTFLVYAIYWGLTGQAFRWYLIPAGLIIGVLASYAAMFGYDKLLSKISELKTIIDSTSTEEEE